MSPRYEPRYSSKTRDTLWTTSGSRLGIVGVVVIAVLMIGGVGRGMVSGVVSGVVVVVAYGRITETKISSNGAERTEGISCWMCTSNKELISISVVSLIVPTRDASEERLRN
ncbi:hypothetical protein Tco_1478526 [Tanacetum coccineum]